MVKQITAIFLVVLSICCGVQCQGVGLYSFVYAGADTAVAVQHTRYFYRIACRNSDWRIKTTAALLGASVLGLTGWKLLECNLNKKSCHVRLSKINAGLMLASCAHIPLGGLRLVQSGANNSDATDEIITGVLLGLLWHAPCALAHLISTISSESYASRGED